MLMRWSVENYTHSYTHSGLLPGLKDPDLATSEPILSNLLVEAQNERDLWLSIGIDANIGI